MNRVPRAKPTAIDRMRRHPKLTLAFASQLLVACGLAATSRAHPEIPGAPQQGPIAVVGGTVHTVSGKDISHGVVLFDQGRITAVGPAGKIDLPEGVEQVDASGKHVYPGLFAPFSNLGLVEINAVRATRDMREVGAINPNARVEVSVNPDSELIPVTRSNGVLLALTAPTGDLLSGTSAVLQLDGWTYEDLTLHAPAAMHLRWPSGLPVQTWTTNKSAEQQREARRKRLTLIDKAFADARAYRKARRAASDKQEQPARDARWEAMLPVLDGKLPLMVHANDLQQIQEAVAFAQRQEVKLILLGGYDAPQAAALLKRHDVPVIVGGVYRLPRRRGDAYDAAYTLARRLQKAGVRYCIAGTGRFGASNLRNLPYHAATAAAFGLSRDEALRAITLYPAQVLGVADRVGSLEVGKDATLIVTDGNPLDTPTQVEAAYIQGRQVPLNDRHKRLWRKYQTKYRRQQD